MAGVDLSLYKFEYDLTFAALLMNADGTIYHRYGGRDEIAATARLSMTSLMGLMKETLEDHADYQKSPKPPKLEPKLSIEDLPPIAKEIEKRKAEKKQPECFHCHMVNDALREIAQEKGAWKRDDIWLWPPPDRIGLKLDRDDPMLLRAVIPSSPVEAAGLEAGDRLIRLGGERVRSHADIQWVLENASRDSTSIPVEYKRGSDAPKSVKVDVAKGWKAGTPLALSWRPAMWSLKPQPGFGGERLDREELEKLGLEPGAFAMKIGYLVDWEEAGRVAKKAGLRKGDIVLSAAGEKNFASERHFQSWFRLTQKPGAAVALELLRDGKRMNVELPLLPE
jgi:hypothetical protein